MNEKSVELLNKAVADEMSAVHQYTWLSAIGCRLSAEFSGREPRAESREPFGTRLNTYFAVIAVNTIYPPVVCMMPLGLPVEPDV